MGQFLYSVLESLYICMFAYMGYVGMCRCEGYGFQEVYSRIGYINQSVWV